MGKNLIKDAITITLDRNQKIYIDLIDSPLTQKWFLAFEHLLQNNYHLDKSFCFLGYPKSQRDGKFICDEINKEIAQINLFFDGKYKIERHYTFEDLYDQSTQTINQEPLNWLHRYFEELQGHADGISNYYTQADGKTRLSIRRLNLLCHEFESWIKSFKKTIQDPEWIRPSQLLTFINPPYFTLEDEDFELFGIDSLYRQTGGVYLGVNKTVGKTHYEVFCDENSPDLDELITTSMRSQFMSSGEIDIEWANTIDSWTGPNSKQRWKKQELERFREWLTKNGFDPDDKKLGIGSPKIGQVNLIKSFGTIDWKAIMIIMSTKLNIVSVETKSIKRDYPYRWNDHYFDKIQQEILSQ